MNNKIWISLLILFLTVSCGGGGGGGSYSSGSSNSSSSTPSLSNLNSANSCKTAWYTTTMPTPTSIGSVFKNYTFFWQDTPVDVMPICLNYYELTNAIESPWKTYIAGITEYSKYTLGQIVPINVFILGANPQSGTNSSEKQSYLADFATVQSPVGPTYTTALANAQNGDFPITSAGGGYSFEAAPNGADMQIPQSLIWGITYGSESEKIQKSFKVIAHEYFHTYQNSIKFFNEINKTISLPIAWVSNPNLLDNENASVPAYFPWWIEEGGADFGAFVLAAKYANTIDGISTNPAEQFESHFSVAWDHFNDNPGASLADFNLVGLKGYEVGASALLYLWSVDNRNFNAAMSKYYTSWQEAEAVSSGNGWQEAFFDVFWKNSTEYYTLTEFVTEFDSWIRDGDKASRWSAIAKSNAEIIHANVEPTTANTPTSATRTIVVDAAAKIVRAGSGNRYFIDGVQQKTLVVKAGKTYKFSFGASHPLRFSTTDNGTWGPDGISGNSDDGTQYTNNVTSTTTDVIITMPNSSSIKTLYYYCGNHPGMGGKILIVDQYTENNSSGGSGSGSGGSGGGGSLGPGGY